MAYSKITTNKRGVLQAKIQAYGLDPMTGKSKLYVKTVHNTDNLSEAKFKKYVAKAEIEFEESIKLTGKTSAIEKTSTDGVLTFTQLVKEWKTSVLQNLSRNYYGRICVTEKLFTSFLVEHHLADKPISEITVRHVQLFLNSFCSGEEIPSGLAKLKKPLPDTINGRQMIRDNVINTNSLYRLKHLDGAIRVQTAKNICEYCHLKFDDYFEPIFKIKECSPETIKGHRRILRTLFNEAVDKMRGKPGTKVKLTIRRVNEKPFDITLKREEIKTQSVKSDIKDNDVLYVRISSFSEDVANEVTKAFEKAKKNRKTPLKGIVLDVRNNPGGLLDQAVAVSGLFLDQGEVVSTRARNEEDTQRYSAKGKDITEGLPLVVIINNGSASASEIVAGALQDHKRAVILGEKSFGKGSVQTVVPLGNYGAMRLTTARYYTPSGRSIQATGIEPDITVHLAKLEEFIPDYGFSEAEYTNALKNETLDSSKNKSSKDSKETNEDWRQDYQLSRAVDLIKALNVYISDK